jgi:3-oxoacyl-[acyl-carrier-protein] synthase II
MSDEIVITGMGVVTPIGGSVESFWDANLQGRSGLRLEDRMDLSALPCGWVAGIIPDDVKASVRERWDRAGRSWGDCLLHDSVDQALRDARFDRRLDRAAGLIWSKVWPGPSGPFPEDYVEHMKDAAERYNSVGTEPAAVAEYLRGKPLALEAIDLSAFPAEMSERLGAPLIATRLEATCAGGLRAIAEASRLLQMGKVKFAVVAVSVSRSTPYVLSQFAQLMALSRWQGPPEYASMPFDKRRSGMVLSESAGALVLETAEHASRRGVDDVHAVIGGWGLAVGIEHLTAPSADAVEHVIRGALEHSSTLPEDIDSINAHGTSTRLNDMTEARALHRVFGEYMKKIDVCAVKSLTGHGAAASGVVESVVAALTLCRGVVPPVVTCTEPDPSCDVNTSVTPVERPVTHVLKNSFGFGGQYVSMVFQRPSNPRLSAAVRS